MSNILISPRIPSFGFSMQMSTGSGRPGGGNNPDKHPNLRGKNAVMDPWLDYAEPETRDTKKDFNYNVDD